MEILEKIKSELASFDEKRKALLAELKDQFSPILKPLFEKYPMIESIGWRQYTPYFNDGDECIFSRREDLYVNGEDEEDFEPLHDTLYVKITEENQAEAIETAKRKNYSWIKNNIGENGYVNNPNQNHEMINGVKEFKDILNSIPEDFYKELFGDHVKVTVSSSGSVDVEEYEHD